MTTLASFLAAAARAIGAEHVIADVEGLAPFARVMMPVPEADHAPAGVVSPASVVEVRALLALAREHKAALWPTSTGRNFGYGSSACATPGQVVLDLRRMNRILDIDPVLGTALVEPGVTYQQLADHLAAEKIPLWIDAPGPGPLVSPMGNTLERGGGLTPYGDHFANSCGYEVVLADGTVLRTGMGGVEGTTSWQAYRYGYGPFLDGLFTQSNFGVVTKIGLWLMPAPEAHRTVLAIWDDPADIARLTDAVRPLRIDGTIGNFGVLFNSTLALTTTSTRADLYQGAGSFPQDLSLATARKRGLGAWHYLYSHYGPRDRVAADFACAKAALEIAGARLIPDVHDAMSSGELTLSSFTLLNWTGGHGLAWFSPVSPMRGADMAKQMRMAREIMDAHGFDFMTGVSLVGREALNVMPLVFDRGDPEATERARACFSALIEAFGAAGYGLYRTGVGFMDQAAELHGAVNIDINRRIKRALDPDGVLAPGKSGIRI